MYDVHCYLFDYFLASTAAGSCGLLCEFESAAVVTFMVHLPNGISSIFQKEDMECSLEDLLAPGGIFETCSGVLS